MAWVGPRPLYQTERSVATGDMLLEPPRHGICQIQSLSTEVDSRQAVVAFEVLDDVAVVSGTADLGYSEETDQLFLGHERRPGKKRTLWDGESGWQVSVWVCAVHGHSPGVFSAGYRPEQRMGVGDER